VKRKIIIEITWIAFTVQVDALVFSIGREH